MTYKFTNDPAIVQHVESNSFFSPTGEGIYPRLYQKWIADGNPTLPADAATAPPAEDQANGVALRALVAFAKLMLVKNPDIAAQMSPVAKLIIARATDT